MKKLLVLAIIALLVFGAYRVIKAELKTNLELNTKVAGVIDKIDEAGSSIIGMFKGLKKQGAELLQAAKTGPDSSEEQAAVEAVTLYLKHGGVISGKLLKKRGDSFTVEWKGSPFEVEAGQIARVEYKTERDVEWPYASDVAVVRTNGIILDGAITDVAGDEVKLLFTQGGGTMEMTIRRSDIDHLLFAPVCTRESSEIEKRLKAVFPKMKVYKDGNITLFTDSYDTWVKTYRKALAQKYTEIYLKFFKLFKGRKPVRQSFVVVFDDWEDYLKNMFADMGFVSLGIVGYFSPSDKVLYSYNAWGQRIEKFYFDWVNSVSGAYDNVSKNIRDRYKDGSVDIMVEGLSKELQDKYWDWYAIHREIATGQTLSVVKHELTHEILHNWELQNIIISKAKVNKNEMARKKKEILDAIEGQDREKLEQLFVQLFRMKKAEHEGLTLEAANSWLSEGMATYCETAPIGSINEERLFSFQESERKNAVNPIEFLTNFKMGSFSGLSGEAALDAYGESWALTTFLMEKYPDQFIAYQIKFATQKPKDGDEDLQWLLKAVGKDLPTLEKEFRTYMATYDVIEDPEVKLFMRYQTVKDAFYQVWERHR